MSEVLLQAVRLFPLNHLDRVPIIQSRVLLPVKSQTLETLRRWKQSLGF